MQPEAPSKRGRFVLQDRSDSNLYNQQETDMTVNELIDLLTEFRDEGRGNTRVWYGFHTNDNDSVVVVQPIEAGDLCQTQYSNDRDEVIVVNDETAVDGEFVNDNIVLTAEDTVLP